MKYVITYLLRDPPPHAHVEFREHLPPRLRQLVPRRKLEDHAEGVAPGHDRRLVHWVRPSCLDRHHRVATLVVPESVKLKFSVKVSGLSV